MNASERTAGSSGQAPGSDDPHGGFIAEYVVAAGPEGLAIRVEEPALVELARQVFPRCPAPAATPRRIGVFRHEDGFLLTPPDGSTVQVAGSETELVVELERQVALHARRARAGELFLHAAGAVGRGGAVVAFGASGSGKSSVALALMRHGLRLLADDMLPVDRMGRVRPFPRHLKVHSDRLEGTGVDPVGTPGHDPSVDEVWLDPTTLAPGFAGGPAPIVAAARLSFDSGAPPLVVTPMDSPSILNVAMNSRFPHPVGPAAAVDRLLRALEGVPAHDLVFSDSMRAAAFLAGAVEGS